MTFLLLVPVLLSFLLIAAHFLRTMSLVMVGLCLGIPLLLFIRRRWVVIVVQFALLLAAIEWLFTLIDLIHQDEEVGKPWTKTLIIIGAVMMFTLASGIVFTTRRLRRRYWRSGVSPLIPSPGTPGEG